MGAWFPKEQGGGMFNLEPWGKSHVSKENTQKTYAHFPLMHSHFHLTSCWGERRDVLIIHPSCFQFLLSFSHFLMPIPSSGFHPKMLWLILIILYSILCMHAVCSPVFHNCVLFWVVVCCFDLQCCCALVSSVTEGVKACLVVLTLWYAMCVHISSLVWNGLEWNWIRTSFINLV